MRAFDRDLERAAVILKAIAHPLRLKILSMLCKHDESVGAIAGGLGAKPNTVSQALRILRGERLVAVTRSSRCARYRLEERSLRRLIPVIEKTLSATGRPGPAGRRSGAVADPPEGRARGIGNRDALP